ncbi:MAG: hypothetical protein RSE95_02475 [Malacoplasma sp.]
MKINKRFKILSVLLIPTISIPLILTSCSSTSTNVSDPNTNTIFENTVNASSNNELNKILPSEADSVSNKSRIISFILSDSIIGKKNNLEAKDINIHTFTPDNVNGTLEVKYHIKNYWENGNKIAEGKEVSLVITGFVKQTSPTTFVSSTNKDISAVPELSKFSTNELVTNKSVLQKWLFDNEITGNKESLTFNDISIVNFSNGDSASGTTTIQYDLVRYWTTKGMTNIKKTISIAFSGFKKVNLTDEQTLQEINSAGEIGGLTIDRFSPIIAYLQLTNRTRINTLTDEEINKRVAGSANSSLNHLRLEITSGNQKTQSLVIKISGTYKNITIPVNQQQITISGFYNSINQYEPDFDKFKDSIYVSDIFFNMDEYFNNLQLESNIQGWTSTDWMTKYLSTLTIRKHPATSTNINFNLIDYFQDNIFDNITFTKVAESIAAKSWAQLKVGATYSNYEYNNSTKQWNALASSRLTYNFNTKDLAFNVPTEQDALNWIAKNKTTFNTNISSKYYASYWYSLYRNTNDISSINTVVTVDPTYKAKYFNNQTLSVSLDSMVVKDMLGEMVITYKLNLGESTTSLPTNLETNSFQKLKTFIDANSAELDNLIQVLPRNDKSSLEKSIIRAIKRDFTADFLKGMKVDEVANAKGKPVLFKNSSSYRLFNGDASSNASKLDEKFLEDIRPFLFKKPLSRNNISIDMNLFMPDGRSNNQTKFAINSIVVNIDETSIATLTRFNSTHFTYKVPFTYFVDLGDATPMIEIPSYYFMSVAYSDLYSN